MPADRPNIVLITADQQRYDTTRPLAPPWMRTPHFDDLAARGVVFSRAYSDCPLCVPARVSIMTGQQTMTHGCNGNRPTADVMGRDATQPGRLRALGYQTAAIGKMHFGPQRVRHGFDEMILPQDYYLHMRRLGYDVPQPTRHGLGQNELYPTMATVPEALTLTNWIAQQCVEYIRERRDPSVPFFLWCSFPKPHPPLDPPEPYYSMYRDCDIPAPAVGDWATDDRCPAAFLRHRQSWSTDRLTPQVLREARAAYYGLITQNDYNMGRVLAALQDLDLFDEAMILYASDHGEYLGDHGTSAKTFFHEPSAHVPMLLRMPMSYAGCPNDVTCDAPVTLADVLPTCVAAAGGRCGDDVEGLDLAALARGEVPRREYLEATGTPGQRYAAITDGRWKFMWYAEGGTEQLFDIEGDPRELHDLSGSPGAQADRGRLRSELIRRLAARGSDLVSRGDFVAQPPAGDSEADRRRRYWPGYHTEDFTKDVRH
ncbi:MAG: Arylsulfatase [Phycisphaerae bacterium]|nr:Arylsulfatase [Phycisphaerae bacterium]